MAIDNENRMLDLTGDFLHNKVKEQKWYQENANFTTTLAGFLATVAAWAAVQPFAVDPRVQMLILAAGFIATVLGVRKTPNGFSKSQLAKIEDYRAKVIGETPLVVEAPVSDQDNLDSLVKQYIQKTG